MNIEIEFNSGQTNSDAVFTVFFRDETTRIPHAAEGKILLASDKQYDCNSNFEKIVLCGLISTRGVKKIEVVDGYKFIVDCIDMIVDDEGNPVFGDKGWLNIHNSIIEHLERYAGAIKQKVRFEFYDSYPEDFIVDDEGLSIQEIEWLESDRPTS